MIYTMDGHEFVMGEKYSVAGMVQEVDTSEPGWELEELMIGDYDDERICHRIINKEVGRYHFVFSLRKDRHKFLMSFIQIQVKNLNRLLERERVLREEIVETENKLADACSTLELML